MDYNREIFDAEIQTRMDAVDASTAYEDLAYLVKIEALRGESVSEGSRTLLQRKTYLASVAAEVIPEDCNMIKVWATAKGGASNNYGSGAGGGSVDGFEMEVIVGSTLAITYGTSHVINGLEINEPVVQDLTFGQLGGTVVYNGIQSGDIASSNGGNGRYSRSNYVTLASNLRVTLASGVVFSEGDRGNSSTEYGGGASGASHGVKGDITSTSIQYGAGASMGDRAGSSYGMGLQSDIVIEFYQVL